MAFSTCIKTQIRKIVSLAESPSKYNHLFNPKITPSRQAWVENFVGNDKQLLEIIDLHPRIFGVFPRIDRVSETVKWQKTYREVKYLSMPTRHELPGANRKPWPQKGTGRARHGSVTSPIWTKGGWAKGPRGPVTNFRIMPHFKLANTLNYMLTIKLAQDDLKVVDNIDSFGSDDPEDLEKAFEDRRWGPSVLIVDKRELFPESLSIACASLNHVNLMPTYGLNALSMCKHETLVITLKALREIEEKLLHQLVRVDLMNTHTKYRE